MFRCTQLALGVHVIWEPLGRPRDLDDLVSLVPWVSRHLGRITPTDRERNDAFFSAQEAHGLRETVWIETPAGGMDVRVPLPEPPPAFLRTLGRLVIRTRRFLAAQAQPAAAFDGAHANCTLAPWFGVLPPGGRHALHSHNGVASGVVYLRLPGTTRRKGDLVFARLNATLLHVAQREWCSGCGVEANASTADVLEAISRYVYPNASRLDGLFHVEKRISPEIGSPAHISKLKS